MAGRIFAVLILGIAAAALLASVLAQAGRDAAVAAERADRVVDRIVAAIAQPGGDRPPPPGTRRLPALPPGEMVPALSARLAARLPRWRGAMVVRVDAAACVPVPPVPPPPRLGGAPPLVPPAPVAPAGGRAPCYAARLVPPTGAPVLIAVDAPPSAAEAAPVASPLFLAALGLAVVLLAMVVARMAARPIERLGAAAQRLAADLDAAPMAVRGPSDVRAATAAFNDMQVELRRTLEERTYMLAAISHDLRSPLTRMRLRFEAVAEAELRDRLIADANAMTALIEDGLELARMTREEGAAAVPVDVGALVASLCEDAQDIGQRVSIAAAPRLVVRTQAEALRRIVANLLDNALLHGGGAAVRIEADAARVGIHVADRGPGIPADALDRVFDPFRRLDPARTAGQGSGLGLTIARLLADRIGVSVALRARAGGGLEATVTIPRA